MASVSGLTIANGQLAYGRLQAPLELGTSFTAQTDKGNENTITVYFHNKGFQTTCHLVFKTQEVYQDAIRQLLQQPHLGKHLFYASKIEINENLTQVALSIFDDQGIRNFLTHGTDLCRAEGFDVEAKEEKKTFRNQQGALEEATHRKVILTDRAPTPDLEKQAQKINTLFKTLMDKLGPNNIPTHLERLNDPRFPVEPTTKEMGCLGAAEWIEYHRDYQTEPNGAVREFIFGKQNKQISADVNELATWFKDPTQVQHKIIENYFQWAAQHIQENPDLTLDGMKNLFPEHYLENERFKMHYRRFLIDEIRKENVKDSVNAIRLGALITLAGEMKTEMKIDVKQLLSYKNP